MGDLGVWEKIISGGAAAVAWVSGETGRVLVSGASGGLFRWWMSERRRLRDGIVATVSGAVSAVYLGPVVLGLMGVVGLAIDPESAAYSGGFIAGLAGMSLAKVTVAIVENRAAALSGGKND